MGDSIWKKWPSGPFYIIYWFGCLKSPRWWLGWQNARGHGDVEIWCGSNRRPLSNIPLHCICNHILISLIMIPWHSQMICLVMKYLHLIRNDTSFNKSPKMWCFPLTNTVLELQPRWRLFYWNKNRGLRVELLCFVFNVAALLMESAQTWLLSGFYFLYGPRSTRWSCPLWNWGPAMI